MANDVFDIALLLYREYFLKIKDYRKFVSYLTTSFRKEGMMEEKCYLYKWVTEEVSEHEALRFIEIIESRVEDKSKSNIFVIRVSCLNLTPFWDYFSKYKRKKQPS